MKAILEPWEQSCDSSPAGNDYSATVMNQTPRFFYNRKNPKQRIYLKEFSLHGKRIVKNRSNSAIKLRKNGKKVLLLKQ